MSYQVLFHAAGLAQLKGLPAEAFDALVERVVELVDAPWDASVLPPEDDPAYRMTVFGSGSGLLSFYADDKRQVIRIFDVTWAG